MRRLITALLISTLAIPALAALAACAYGQYVPPPPAVGIVTLNVAGSTGQTTYCYWVIAQYPVGAVMPERPQCISNAPNTLNGSNYVKVFFNPPPGALAYTVLRSTSPAYPLANNACTCAVAINTASSPVNDQGSALVSYTHTPATGASITPPTVNNRDYGSANVTPSQNIPSCVKQTLAFYQLTASATTQALPVLMIPYHAKLIGVSVKHSAAFTGGGLSGMTVSIGDSTQNATYYTSAFNIFQAPGDQTFQDTALFKSGTFNSAGSTVTANFTATSANVNAATQGSVDIRVCYVGIP